MKLPRAARRRLVVRPLLIHEGARVREHSVIPLGVVPRHYERGRTAGAAPHRGARVGVVAERHAIALLDLWQHFALDELRVATGHRVVLQPTLAPLRVAAAIS